MAARRRFRRTDVMAKGGRDISSKKVLLVGKNVAYNAKLGIVRFQQLLLATV